MRAKRFAPALLFSIVSVTGCNEEPVPPAESSDEDVPDAERGPDGVSTGIPDVPDSPGAGDSEPDIDSSHDLDTELEHDLETGLADGETDPDDGFDAGAESPNCDADSDGWLGADCGGDDCDDDSALVYPGAVEVCDGIDQNCDGQVDEGVVDACGGCGELDGAPGDDCDDCADVACELACLETALTCLPSPALVDGWVRVEPGTFMMGRESRPSEMREREVTHTYYIQSMELTEEEWGRALVSSGVGSWPIYRSGNPTYPIDGLSLYSALSYANWLSDEWGLPRCYEMLPGGCADDRSTWTGGDSDCDDASPLPEEAPLTCIGFRVPTEVEWEYAARAGTRGATYAGDYRSWDLDCDAAEPTFLNDIAWWCGNTAPPIDRHRPGGMHEPNPWGLYDVIGNVREIAWGIEEPGGRPVGCGGAADIGPNRDLFAAGREEYDSERRSRWRAGVRLVRTAP